MMLYPEVQKRAQAELDSVIGPDRLATLDDQDNLPYITAIVKETLRWSPVAPEGMDFSNLLAHLYNNQAYSKLHLQVFLIFHVRRTYIWDTASQKNQLLFPI
jgi:hypothetical protein